MLLDSGNYLWGCGGSLIRPTVVLTAGAYEAPQSARGQGWPCLDGRGCARQLTAGDCSCAAACNLAQCADCVSCRRTAAASCSKPGPCPPPAAAHCLFDRNGAPSNPVGVALGVRSLQGDAPGSHEIIRVAQVVRHPLYDPNILVNDVGLLLLDRPAAHAPVALANLTWPAMRAGAVLYTAGWGATEGSDYSPDLRWAAPCCSVEGRGLCAARPGAPVVPARKARPGCRPASPCSPWPPHPPPRVVHRYAMVPYIPHSLCGARMQAIGLTDPVPPTDICAGASPLVCCWRGLPALPGMLPP